MARAAVKAKQAQAAQAQAAVNTSRKQRKHAAGGNPNQDLFFMRLRRKQKWVFAMLAIVFAVSFVALGVGSGNGTGLESLYNGIFGGGGDAVAKAKKEIEKNPAKGYQDLATAYATKNDLTGAANAMQSYLKLKGKEKDANAWAQLGGYQQQQGNNAASDYQTVLQNGALQSPGSILQPTGALAGQLGSNPIDQYYSQQTQAAAQPLLQQAIAAYNDSLTAYEKAAKYASREARPDMLLALRSAAQLAGNQKTEFDSLRRYIQAVPTSPLLSQFQAQCKQLAKALKKNVSACTVQSAK